METDLHKWLCFRANVGDGEFGARVAHEGGVLWKQPIAVDPPVNKMGGTLT